MGYGGGNKLNSKWIACCHEFQSFYCNVHFQEQFSSRNHSTVRVTDLDHISLFFMRAVIRHVPVSGHTSRMTRTTTCLNSVLLPRARAQLVGARQSGMSRNSCRTCDKLILTFGVMVVKHPRCPIACLWLCQTTMCKDICYTIRQFIIRHDSECWSVSGLNLCSLILA